MKAILASALLATLATSALAQPRPAKAPPPPAPPQAGPSQAGPSPVAEALFPCRSEAELCFVGVVKGGKLLVLFTNDPKGADAAGKAVAVEGGGLGGSEGRLVMVTGSYDAKAGLTKAEVVDTASPLTAFAIKSAIGGGGNDSDGPGAPPPPPPPGKKK